MCEKGGLVDRAAKVGAAAPSASSLPRADKAAAGRAARFVPPKRSVREIERTRLFDLPQRRALLLQAPAGYGKTTLLAQIWSARSADSFKPWLSLAPGHRGFARFRDALASALSAAGLSPPEHGGASPADDGGRLAEFLSNQDRPVYLTLDNYQAAAGGEVDALMRELLSQSSGAAHFAIATRERPNIGVAALAARGDLVRVQAAALRFSLVETTALLETQFDARQIAGLHEQAEGWPAALQLALRSREASCQTGRQPVPACAARGEIGAYLAEETFDSLPDALKEFLIETAPLETLDAEAADFVRARQDSAAQLAALERSGALIFVDDESHAVRRHRLLQEFLETRFALLPMELRRDVVERTIEYCARRGDCTAAFRLACRLEPARPPLSLLETAPFEGLWSAENFSLASAFVALDETLFVHAPRLAALRAAALHGAGRTEEARQAGREAASALAARLAASARAQMADPDALLWSGLSAALFDEGASHAGLARISAAARTAGRGAGPAMLAHAAAVLALRAGLSADARTLACIGASAAASAAPADAVLALTGVALTALFDAAPHAASAALKEGSEIADAHSESVLPLRPARLVCEALMRRERGEDWEAIALSVPDTVPWLLGFSPEILVESARLAARAALDASGFAAGRDRLQCARATAQERGWRRAEAALAAEELALAARAGERKAAARLARKLAGGGAAQIPECALALALHDLELTAYASARDRLARLLAAPGLPARWRARGLVLDARAAMAMDDRRGAEGAITAFLAQSRDGVMAATLFEDGGADLFDFALSHASRSSVAEGRGHMLNAAADLATARPRFRGEGALAAPTAQETALFEALRRHGGRAQAARELSLSENTLKFYLKRIFQKWGVNDWRTAVKVAERMGALESPEGEAPFLRFRGSGANASKRPGIASPQA